MKRYLNISYCLLLLYSLTGCNTQKKYFQKDYSFYDRNFHPDPASLLRSDGVYVQEKIRTNEQGGKERVPAERKIYKFYKGGQANMILDPDRRVETTTDYATAFNVRIRESTAEKKRTLFERYYKYDGNRMVIQAVNTPRNQFYYEYALLEKDGLILVKSTHRGGGEIKDKYYTDYYKEYYRFVPTGENGYLEPNW